MNAVETAMTLPIALALGLFLGVRHATDAVRRVCEARSQPVPCGASVTPVIAKTKLKPSW
jgi:hypothetical protein